MRGVIKYCLHYVNSQSKNLYIIRILTRFHLRAKSSLRDVWNKSIISKYLLLNY